jgi:hypothetical protein
MVPVRSQTEGHKKPNYRDFNLANQSIEEEHQEKEKNTFKRQGTWYLLKEDFYD